MIEWEIRERLGFLMAYYDSYGEFPIDCMDSLDGYMKVYFQEKDNEHRESE